MLSLESWKLIHFTTIRAGFALRRSERNILENALQLEDALQRLFSEFKHDLCELIPLSLANNMY